MIIHAIQNPIGTKRLREIIKKKKEARIVIVVDDHTRAAPKEEILGALTEEIWEEQKSISPCSWLLARTHRQMKKK
ncbi:MAG: lactate racemase domain-containing protein [Methanophagales archaeon]|nr:lactate racemase domain-containing protein [Methanophagales archaeon]MCW3141875.1 lactate racemase domain-containing protein [Methanophagales archaeon]